MENGNKEPLKNTDSREFWSEFTAKERRKIHLALVMWRIGRIFEGVKNRFYRALLSVGSKNP
jgi:hypothetical protein